MAAAASRRGKGVFEILGGNALLGSVTSLVSSAVVSIALWPLLALPGQAVESWLGSDAECTAPEGTVSTCAGRSGLVGSVAAVLMVGVVIVLSPLLGRAVGALTARLPKGASTFVAPLVATALFTMVYAAMQQDTDGGGIVPPRVFPATVGLFTFVAGRLAPLVGNRLGGAIGKRNAVSPVWRGVIVVGVALVGTLLTTGFGSSPQTVGEQQAMVVATMLTSYVAFVPRDGDLLGAVQGLVARSARRRRKATT